MHLTRRGFTTLAATALATPAVHAQNTTVIRFGFANIGVDNRQFSGGSAAATAHSEGYIQRELKDLPGVTIEFYFFKGAGPAVNEAFANGQLDFASQGDLPQVVGLAAGLKTVQLMANGAHSPTFLAVQPDSTIQSVKDLKGRKVAIFRGTNGHLSVVKILAANGLSERDLQVINMDEASSSAALAARDIDATFGDYGPLILAEKKLAKIVYSTKGDSPAFERQGTVIAARSFVDAHPDLTQRVITALVRAADFSSQEKNREPLFQIWARSGRSVDSYRDDFAEQSLAYRNSPLLDPFMLAQYQAQAEQARSFGLIRHAADEQGWFNTRFLDAALAELTLEHAWPRHDPAGKEIQAG